MLALAMDEVLGTMVRVSMLAHQRERVRTQTVQAPRSCEPVVVVVVVVSRPPLRSDRRTHWSCYNRPHMPTSSELLTAGGADCAHSMATLLCCSYVKSVYETSPMHVLAETSLVIVIVYILLFKKSYDPTKRCGVRGWRWLRVGSLTPSSACSGYGERPPEELTEAEIDEMVEEWRPEPLLPAVAPKDRAYDGEEVVVRRVEGLEMHVQGREQPLLNFATFDFLGMSTNPRVKQVCKEVLDTYTLGSCGPRGFYGTFDKHLEVRNCGCARCPRHAACACSPLPTCAAGGAPGAFPGRGGRHLLLRRRLRRLVRHSRLLQARRPAGGG